MALHYSPNIVTNGLVLALDASDPKSYPGSGSTWFDRSGNGNNGTMVNMTFSDKTMVFNGSDGQVNTNVVPNYNEGTISCWFNIDLQKNFNTIFDNAVGANDWEMWIYDYGELRFRTTASGADLFMSIPNIQINLWYHMTLTWNTLTGAIYLNGVQIVTDGSSLASRITPTQLRIGGSINTRFDGRMGSFHIYNRALSASEISQNFNATRGRFGI
jgi:hypothetical protein